MKSYHGCAVLMGIVVSNGIGAGMALVCACCEGARIRQWGRILERCQTY